MREERDRDGVGERQTDRRGGGGGGGGETKADKEGNTEKKRERGGETHL